MRIIISPAKKMCVDTDTLAPRSLPAFIDDAERLREWLRSLSYDELKKLWACSDKIARENVELLERMDLRAQLTPALLAYDGIQYTYMAPTVFEDGHFSYVEDHLRILSGFYGVLRPLDGVVPYRLEMQAKANVGGCKNLYAYWGDRLYHEVMDESDVLINLASQEYAKAVTRYLQPDDCCVSVVFGEVNATSGRVVQKGVYAKMARGEMVRYLASVGAEDPACMRGFCWSGYSYDEARSTPTNYVFVR